MEVATSLTLHSLQANHEPDEALQSYDREVAKAEQQRRNHVIRRFNSCYGHKCSNLILIFTPDSSGAH